jgi:hypothetical protein
VQRNARVVGERDPGARGVEALIAQQRKQRPIQRPADSAAVVIGGDVHGDVDRPAIGGAVVMARSVRVADHRPAVLGDQPREVALDEPHPLGDLVRLGRPLLQRRHPGGHRRRVDRRARTPVAVGVGVADQQRSRVAAPAGVGQGAHRL